MLIKSVALITGLMALSAKAANRDNFPPLIPSRCEASSDLVFYPYTLENDISRLNGVATSNGDTTIDGFTIDYDIPINKTTITEADGVYQATPDQISRVNMRSKLAALAYCPSISHKGRWDCSNCVEYVPDGVVNATFVSQDQDILGYALVSDTMETIFLVFGGTFETADGEPRIDFNATSYTPVEYTNVNKDLYELYSQTQEDVIFTIQDLIEDYPDYNVDIIGHSLGGAQAEFATLDAYQRLEQLTSSNLFLTTFGEPRVGDKEYASYVAATEIEKIRVVNGRDLVAHLAPMDLDFVHGGSLEYWVIDNETDFVQICENKLESNECSNSIVPFLNYDDNMGYPGLSSDVVCA